MRKTATLLFATALSITVAGCGSTTTTSSGTAATTTTASSAGSTGSSAPSGGATGSSTGSSSSNKKVSANTATEAELVAALTAAGVSNPSRWANEIDEYRPYDTSDPSLSKLKSELAKYNPGTDTLNKILSVLQP